MKKVFLTGASRGIGTSIGKGLIDAGFQVTGTHHRTEIPQELRGHSSFSTIKLDLSDIQHVTHTLKKTFIENPTDVLINNAGIFAESGMMEEDADWLSVWDKTMTVNLKASSLLCKWFINGCINSGKKGIIINIASRAAYRGDLQEYAAYAASKGGMAAFTKSIARGFGRSGIVAYTIAPGFIRTDMAEEAIDRFGVKGITRDSSFDEMTTPEEVAKLVVWLSHGEVPHMSGSTFHINGGSYMI